MAKARFKRPEGHEKPVIPAKAGIHCALGYEHEKAADSQKRDSFLFCHLNTPVDCRLRGNDNFFLDPKEKA
jgi:hypothetical protein